MTHRSNDVEQLGASLPSHSAHTAVESKRKNRHACDSIRRMRQLIIPTNTHGCACIPSTQGRGAGDANDAALHTVWVLDLPYYGCTTAFRGTETTTGPKGQ